MTRRTSQVAGRPGWPTIGLAALLFGLALHADASSATDPYAHVGLGRIVGQVDLPEFVLRTPDGAVIDRRTLQGRVVLANFWATWCEPCKEEMPALERLHTALSGEPFQLIAITADDRVKAIAHFAHSLSLTFPILLDEEEAVSDALLVRGLPTTVLIGKDGRILARAVGPRAWDSPEMIALIRSLTGRSP